MILQRIRIALLVCTVLAISASSALAQTDKAPPLDKISQEKIAPPIDKVTPPTTDPLPAPPIGTGNVPVTPLTAVPQQGPITTVPPQTPTTTVPSYSAPIPADPIPAGPVGPISSAPAGPIASGPVGPVGPIASGPVGGGCGGCGATTRTIYVTESVPETYTATRTVYRNVCRTEVYTAYRTESIPEIRERTVCCTKRIPVTTTQVRKVCVNVPVCEDRTVMKQVWSYQNVTTFKCRTVDRGHWECKEVYSCCKAFANWCSNLGSGFGRGHGHQNADPCNPCPQTCQPQVCQAPPTKTVKVWVPCCVTEQIPVTCCKKICTNVPTLVKVTVNRTEYRDVPYQCTTYQCVTENRVEKYTVYTCRQVPFQATRQVSTCVPQQETYTATRMVCRTVARQVTDTTCCSAPCDVCTPASGGHGGGLFSRCRGLFNRGGNGGCGGCGGGSGGGLFGGFGGGHGHGQAAPVTAGCGCN